MADVKVTELTEVTALAESDVFHVVDDPGGTPISKKATVKTLLDTRLNYSIAGTDFNLSAASGVQSAFAAAGDVFTLVGSTTYQFEGIYYITKSGTTCTTAMAFALGGGASVTFIAYNALAQNVAANTTGATFGGAWVNQVGSTVINATSTGEVVIRFRGLVRMNAGGTVTPQVNFSAAPTSPVMKAGSFIMFTPIGTTNNVIGAVA